MDEATGIVYSFKKGAQPQKKEKGEEIVGVCVI